MNRKNLLKKTLILFINLVILVTGNFQVKGNLFLTGVGPDTTTMGHGASHDQQVAAGLAALHREERRYAEGGRISRPDAQKAAAAVKEQRPVFKSLVVVDRGGFVGLQVQCE